MQKKFIKRGRHVTLSLIENTVSEVYLNASQLPTLVFHDTVNGDSQVQIEEAVTLSQNGVDLYLTGSRPGSTFDPKQLHPLLELLDTSVVDA